MSDDNQNKSHWSSIFNWNIIKKFVGVVIILVIIYVIMACLSPLAKLGRNVAHAFDSFLNVVTKAFDGLCAKSGTCLAAPGQDPKTTTTGTCNPGNPDTKGQECSLTEQEQVDGDSSKDASDGPCGSKWNGWCALFPIGLLVMWAVGGPFALLGYLYKYASKGKDYLCDQISAIGGRDVAKILRESTDGVADYAFKDKAAVDKVLEKKYPKDEEGKFTDGAITNLGIKTKDGDLPLDPTSLQKRAQEQYDKLRDTQVDIIQFKRQRSVILEKNKGLAGTKPDQWKRVTQQNTEDTIQNQKDSIDEATKDLEETAAESARDDAKEIENEAEIPKPEGI